MQPQSSGKRLAPTAPEAIEQHTARPTAGPGFVQLIVGRWRGTWRNVAASCVAATLAWTLAQHLFGHPQPFFAAIAAIVSLAPGLPSYSQQACCSA